MLVQLVPDRKLPRLKWIFSILTATKVMALLNAANNLGPNIVEYTDFYNVSLDHMDLMSEYYTWQNPDRPGQFSYCQVISWNHFHERKFSWNWFDEKTA